MQKDSTSYGFHNVKQDKEVHGDWEQEGVRGVLSLQLLCCQIRAWTVARSGSNIHTINPISPTLLPPAEGQL